MLILIYIIQIYYLNILIIEKKPKSTGAEKIMKVKKSIYKQRCSQLSRLCPFPRGSPVCSGCRRQPPWEGTHLFPAQVALRGLGDRPFWWTCMTGMLSPGWTPDRCAHCLWKAPGHTGQGPHCPVHHVHLHQATEQGTCD